ncbi:hypothetical protein BGZ93_010105 [Podila epicladia]|nr:hypothetical protein BGZ92_006689 [Podila epicladia]KAG0098850.1 hypothetical protein BGZ93_010105 [Podila epicladia]
MSAFHPDCILRVQQPNLAEEFPGNSNKFTVVDPINMSKWTFTMTRAYDILNITVTLGGYTGPSLKGNYMHIIPMNGGKPVMFDYTAEPWDERKKVSVHFHNEIVQHGDVYGFHFVQANIKELPWYFLAPAESKTPQALPGYEESVSVTSKNTVSALLCDIYSVDTQIVFGSAREENEISLWAHRTILAKFPAFYTLLKQASLANRNTFMGPLRLTVTKVSLSVFATLLRFLYVGEVQRHNFPEDFAITKSNWWGAGSDGGNKDRHLWQPLDLDTPLSVEPVTWEELLDAATIYRIDVLRAHCRTAIKSEFNGDKSSSDIM